MGFPANEFVASYINVDHIHPPNSPDLNPIEKVWGILKNKVFDGEKREFYSVVDLRKIIVGEWENITQIKIRKHIDNLFEERLQLCIDANGDYF